jgi:hypothetical protein
MMPEVMLSDSRPVHVKLISTPGGVRFCTVFPPAGPSLEEIANSERVHRHRPKQATAQTYMPHFYEGTSMIQDWALTRMDKI